MQRHNETQANVAYQHTLADTFSCIGPGVHTGITVVMTVMPGEPNTGYVFFRKDVDPEMGQVAARWHTVTDTQLSTTVSNRFGIRVSTVEHLLAALYASGIDNARIVLDGPEVPIMDGSAKCFMEFISQVGRKAQRSLRQAIVITKPIAIELDGACAQLVPNPKSIFEMHIDFPGTIIGQQSYTAELDQHVFQTNISAARTFGLTHHIETLKRSGLAKGGSLQNAVVVDGDRILNEEGLRYADEFVRHKTLDSIGDLALAGATIIGKFTGIKSGHKLNNLLLRKLMHQNHSSIYTTVEHAQKQWQSMVDYSIAV